MGLAPFMSQRRVSRHLVGLVVMASNGSSGYSPAERRGGHGIKAFVVRMYSA